MIDQLKIEQINDVMTIWFDTNSDAHDFISKHYWENHYEEVKEAISCADVFVFKEEVIKGFIGIINGDYVAGLFVLGEYQGKGIGKQLLDACKEKYQSLALDVYVKNQQAVSFYLKQGFVIEKAYQQDDVPSLSYKMKWESTVK